MSSQFEPQESDCDAPPYHTVRACQGLGFESPLDVRWCRLRQFLSGHADPRISVLRAWAWLLGQKPPGKTCVCGNPLPALDQYTFTLQSERQAHYVLGQCRRCHTIFWDDAAAIPTKNAHS
jgi:hypothetical protein